MNHIRGDFPILEKDIIYFDNACMTLRPKQVVEAMNTYYNEFPACALRSHHKLAKIATEKVAEARKVIAHFFSIKPEETVFTRNATEGLNLVAHSLGLKKGDTVITTDKEHNSNLVPWLQKKEQGVLHRVIPSQQDNTFDMDAFHGMMNKDVTLVSVVHTSNLDGVSNPVEEIIKISHDYGALCMLDCAQSAAHQELNLKRLDADFAVCSAHKMLGPSGMGMLFGKQELLEKLQPFMTGGDTVKSTTYDSYEMLPAPEKFEAGLQDYAGILGFSAATKYLRKIGMEEIATHEVKLNKIITDGLSVDIIGPKDPALRSGIISMKTPIDPHMAAGLLDASANIAVRSGMHCVHSWFQARNLPGSLRASLYAYNTVDECNKFVEAMDQVLRL